MNNMFKDWAFWKPIVLYAGGTLAYFLLLAYLPAKAAAVVAVGALGVFMVYMLYKLGKCSYDLRESQIKNNYRKLTGEDIDDKK